MECWHVCTDWICTWKQLGLFFFSCLFFNFLIQYCFLLCFALITPQSLNSFFDVILPVILHWSSLRPNRNVDFVVSFFFSRSLFFFWTNVTVAHQALYIFTVLPFLMSVKYVDHFVSVTSWSFMSVCTVCVREAVLNLKRKMLFSVRCTIWMCTYWSCSLHNTDLLISLCFENGPETQQGCGKMCLGEKGGKKKISINHWFDAVLWKWSYRSVCCYWAPDPCVLDKRFFLHY